MPDTPRLLALDWGTTRLRARRLGAGGRPIDERSADCGVMRVQPGGFEPALRSLCGDWLQDEGLPLLASGMVGSRQGWVEAPYLDTPATPRAAAAALACAALSDGRVLHVVPGVAQRQGLADSDVMRGEETQLWGAGLSAGEVCVLPGTHSKWAWMGDGGAIERFRTAMTGELYAVLVQHSILGRLIPAQPLQRLMSAQPLQRPQAFADAVGEMLAQPQALTQRLFTVRSGVLLDRLPAEEAADRLSGLLLGAEVAAAQAQGLPPVVWLLGEPGLVERYEQALALAGAGTRRVDDDATARGQWRVAVAAGLVEEDA